MSAPPSPSFVPIDSNYDIGPLNVHAFYGALSIGGSFAYVMFGVSCNQMVWYFRSYPNDPLLFKIFIGVVWAVDIMNLVSVVASLYFTSILRGIGMEIREFMWCSHWMYNLLLASTELCCFLVELFFILRMWRFAEKKYLPILALIPYITSMGCNLKYVYGTVAIRCFPESAVNSIWLIISFGLKILSDGIIAGAMIWMLHRRSRGVRERGGTIRVVRDLIYWTVSTGLVLWISAIVYTLAYTLLEGNYIGLAIYLIRGRTYVITMLAVINDRKRCREVIREPESISLRLTNLTKEETQNNSPPSAFWRSMTSGVVIDPPRPAQRHSSSRLD